MADSFLNKSGVSHLWEKIKAALGDKADKSTTVAGYGITNAYTKAEVDTKVNAKANSATTLNGYGITDAYTKTEVDTKVDAKENTSNKVTSWQSTTDNNHYPSEKLVKDSLDGKANSSHTHTKSQITDFPSSMPASDVYSWAKASSKPSYSTSEISGLQTALDGKANSSHTHTISQITNLQSTLDGKANSSHTHSISQITNLQSTLDGKANASHSHDLLPEKIDVPFNSSTNNTGVIVNVTLPTINAVGKIVTFKITNGSVVNNRSAWSYINIGLALPSSGTYKILYQGGSITATSNTTYTIDISSKLSTDKYNSNYDCKIPGRSTATVTSDATVVLLRIA